MKRKAILLLFLTVPLLLNAQEKPTYEKKTYVSPEGKIYVNKALGLYVWLSTSPDEGSKKYKLTSQETSKYSNPMYLDTDGFNSIRSPSAVDPETRKTVYPIRDIVFEVYADESAPKTKIDLGNSIPFKLDGKSYIEENTKLTLLSSDTHSGVESTYISVNGEPFKKYSSPITFTEEKEYTIKYYAVDNVGNVEETTEIIFVYDKTAPKTTHEINKDLYENIISARSKIALNTVDQGAGIKHIKYQIDDGTVYTYKYPISGSILSQGEHTIKYYAIDKVGNTESENSYTFYVDKTPPTIIEEVIAKTFFANGKEYASGKAQLKLTAFDNKAAVKEIMYSINGGEYKLYEKPVFLTQTSGNLIIKSYAIDHVNNKSQSKVANQKTSIPYIDFSGPKIGHSVSGPKFTTRDTLFINSKSKIYLKSSDTEAGTNRIEYRIDGNNNMAYEKAFSIEEEGVHTISYIGYDNVENSSSNTLVVKVDNTGPEIEYTYSTPTLSKTEGLDNYPKHIILYLSAKDKQNGTQTIKYGFGANATSIYASPIVGFSVGKKKMKIEATDKLGNKTEQTIEFNVTE